MSYLKLRDHQSGTEIEFDVPAVRIGRAPDLELVLAGEGSHVVSGLHARFAYRDGAWIVEDLGSTNGTFLDEVQLSPNTPLPILAGQILGFGREGPRFTVETASATKLAATVVEPAAPAPPPAAKPNRAPPAPQITEARTERMEAAEPQIEITLRELRNKHEFELAGTRFRIGRGRECELRPVQESDTSVSRVHAEIVLREDGAAVVRDARSRNGTIVNGRPVKTEHVLHVGDSILLGNDGPELLVESLQTPRRSGAVSPPAPAAETEAPPEPVAAAPEHRRSFGGVGRTLFIKDLMTETNIRGSKRLRKVMWSFTGLLVVGVGGLYWYSEQRRLATESALTAELQVQREALAAQQAMADSVQAAAGAEYERLRVELENARASSAPSAVVDSLREVLADAQARTEALEASLRRAQGELSRQLAQADSLRLIREAEVERIRTQIASASGNQLPQDLLDSLRQAVRDAEQQLSGIEGQMRAVQGSNLAAVAQANQGAVGLVTAFASGSVFDGSGFAISANGLFITNRHVIAPRGAVADSVFVTMADERATRRADVLSVAPGNGPDVAILRIRRYDGPHVPRVDWTGERAQQGEPAALIGFPAGLAAALDRTRTVRTSMSAGIFSKVTPDEIQFDGFTIGGSSGSPIFNAGGEVVALHRAGLAEAVGLGFAVPLRLAVPLVPAAARAEAGIR